MLKDLFSNRIFIGALAFFLLCVGGSLLYHQHVKEQTARDLARTHERIEKLTSEQKPTTQAPVGDTSQGGHFHADGARHEGPHETPVETPTAGETPLLNLSEAESAAILKANRAQQAQRRADYIAKWGEPPSPDGSYQHFRDNHGNVLRHYEGTSVVSHYKLRIGFAPTPAELERYKQLNIALRKATLADEINGGSWENPSAEVQRLSNEIQALVDSAQGEIPGEYGIGYYGASNSGFPSEEEDKRLNAVAIRDLYRRLNIEHLYEFYEERNKWESRSYKGE